MKQARIKDIETAVKMYYEKIELNSEDIRELFGVNNASAVSRLKRQARDQMAKDNVQAFCTYSVDTVCAYRAWRLDIDDLERRYRKLQKINA